MQNGSHSRRSHSILKSVPKMEQSHKVDVEYNAGEVISIYQGYNSGERQVIKRMHKKKRRQQFKKECQTAA